MYVPQRLRPEFDEAQMFEYPEHLRAVIADLPNVAGVYIFHGEEHDGEGGQTLPLYIGKSVNLRTRVLSHLRNPDEARMLRQARRISHIRTAGEIGALLLEARLIKQMQPLFNHKLRRNRQLCSLSLAPLGAGQVPNVVYSNEINFATQPNLYGLFSSRRAALERLRDLADEHRLCYGALGLEKLTKGRACFRAMLHQCAGVCRGDERREVHDQRLIAALEAWRVACWPYPGAIGLIEREGLGEGGASDAADGRQIHVIHNWCYLGSVPDLDQAHTLSTVAAGFDADGYKILCEPMLSGRAEIVVLPASIYPGT